MGAVHPAGVCMTSPLSAEDKRTEHRVIEPALGTSAGGRTGKDKIQRGAAWCCRVKSLCRYTNDLKPAEVRAQRVRTGRVLCDRSDAVEARSGGGWSQLCMMPDRKRFRDAGGKLLQLGAQSRRIKPLYFF
ncbi:hypothetical protein NSPZN2_100447 [Nitrospira defluvii]|uniref:Uncharacterized protein n=1 Tax=Nitrospira defluvii TaxID=330214 RepID=A0ABM8R4S0_9BACT|nr:hypothetical protein NSPZN2_100447 [Nitrospira defluvii]